MLPFPLSGFVADTFSWPAFETFYWFPKADTMSGLIRDAIIAYGDIETLLGNCARLARHGAGVAGWKGNV